MKNADENLIKYLAERQIFVCVIYMRLRFLTELFSAMPTMTGI